MPQMSPLFWLSLLIFFLMILMLFLMLNYSIKPFKMFTRHSLAKPFLKPSWKL
uniref:ATP synthase F0 subunit 8 n=1 Tax=Aparapotamon binchuanense TaxID=2697580 RepID=A0A9E8MHY7_9EUCA|nr:ATP synthase F0 subunit 8 [Aparapotamon binchuanense]WAB69711.1 ATP synthase F0 subunit 8 [Aparapotamon binchuanense]